MFKFVMKQFGTIPATRRDAWGGSGRNGAHRATMTRPRHHHALLLALALVAPGPAAAQPPGARVYVTNNLPGGLGGNSVSVIDAGANTLVATIPVGVGPFGIAVSPDGTRAYVANEGGDTVSVIDAAANTVVATVTDVPGPKAVAVSPDGSLVYVTRTGWDRIALIDTATNTVVDDLQIADPWYLAFTPNGVTLYVSQLNRSQVVAIDMDPNSPTFHTVVATVSLGLRPTLLAVTPDGAFVYVAGAIGEVWVIETTTNTLVATVPLPGGQSVGGLAVTPDGLRAYAVHFRQISVIDTATNTIVANVPLGDGVYGAIAFTAGSCVRGYVCNGVGDVQVLKPAPVDLITAAVPVGSLPTGVAVSPPTSNPRAWTVTAPMPTPPGSAGGGDGRGRGRQEQDLRHRRPKRRQHRAEHRRGVRSPVR